MNINNFIIVTIIILSLVAVTFYYSIAIVKRENPVKRSIKSWLKAIYEILFSGM